ncbi:MAG TPA: glycoside hydrolase family 1 protein, partial [Erysipelothrix sp.]
MSTSEFPKHFMWGAAASAPQTEGAANEGGKSPSTWDIWYEKDPDNFHNKIGPKDTSNVYHLYKEDIKRMQDMNLNSYRTSIAWTRLLPDGKTLNQEAVSYYRDYFSTLKEHGVEPIVNLFHFDMPWWLMEKGGWENYEAIEHFAYYANEAFKAFGDIVSKWTTFNEPMVHIDCGYLGDAHWPMVNDLKRAVQVGYHTLLAHFAAVKAFREGKYDGEIGTILNLSPIYPKDDSKENLEAQEIGEAIYIKSLLDPIALGHFNPLLTKILKENDLMPVKKENDETYLAYGIDFLGVNYYQPLRVQHQPDGKRPIQSRGDLVRGYNWPDKKVNPHRGWEIYEKGVYDIAMTLKNDYNNIPWFLSENGMGVEGE